MSSRIEQLIDEIDEYIENCKYAPLSSTKIVVEKEQIAELLRELRMKTPEEIKHYQKIIRNKEAILNDAKAKAEELIQKTTVHTNQLISEHEIMQQAYTQANEIVTMATRQAQEILDEASMEANNMRMAAMQYTDDILANVESIITQSAQTAAGHYDSLMQSLNHYNEIVQANRNELYPADEAALDEELSSDEKSDTIDVI